MSTSPTNNVPTDRLELRAADQRRRLHSSVTELRSKVHERLDVKRNARSAAGVWLCRNVHASLDSVFRNRYLKEATTGEDSVYGVAQQRSIACH
jgi:hypothetical protein